MKRSIEHRQSIILLEYGLSEEALNPIRKDLDTKSVQMVQGALLFFIENQLFKGGVESINDFIKSGANINLLQYPEFLKKCINPFSDN
jgi:hypothetical protein